MKPEYIIHYFKCMLKSTTWNPVFYSPSLTTITEDDDGGKVIDFSNNDDDTRDRPTGKIYVPNKAYEECPPYAYICFDDDLVAKGAPRYLTVAQYDKVAKAQPASKTKSTSVATPK